MKFGVSTFVTDEGIAPGPLARAVEERGFDSLFVAEHTHIPLSRKSPYPAGGELPRKYCRTLDPFIALTAAAAATERLLLGTGVALLVERDPIITAKEVASLDLVSGGRARATRAFGKDIAIRGIPRVRWIPSCVRCVSDGASRARRRPCRPLIRPGRAGAARC
jgi:alkanesulfonate monooxygenase SsuD/methylene tetrahydromethanopterin reductase-like flavin-dependent oxidoreductase (luciferase family)